MTQLTYSRFLHLPFPSSHHFSPKLKPLTDLIVQPKKNSNPSLAPWPISHNPQCPSFQTSGAQHVEDLSQAIEQPISMLGCLRPSQDHDILLPGVSLCSIVSTDVKLVKSPLSSYFSVTDAWHLAMMRYLVVFEKLTVSVLPRYPYQFLVSCYGRVLTAICLTFSHKY